ncbi:hypothetical protein BDK51DRAFT_46318 [Blyttiomyces helicus]|uniref:Uncharacterized protein n=1 Tax=Blyttiomyces helicus TaxID=388810 RepID=A0A4P9W8Y6_9FUNG|nr:hypothetical protein BDK51DRAFT_46318 [Blyttiomyces helicus]|eukprot:RKO89001.1 hypothetical protein BDK51DRAFT_46318 [Blyttiomyces helicus]
MRLDLQREDLWWGIVVPDPDIESGNDDDPDVLAEASLEAPPSDTAPLLDPHTPSPSPWTTDRKKIASAHGLIMDTLSPHLFHQLATIESPRALTPPPPLTPLFLLDAFAEKQLAEGSYVLAHIAELEAMAAMLESVGEKVSARGLVSLILRSLPLSFAPTVAVIRAMLRADPDKLGVETVRAILVVAAASGPADLQRREGGVRVGVWPAAGYRAGGAEASVGAKLDAPLNGWHPVFVGVCPVILLAVGRFVDGLIR